MVFAVTRTEDVFKEDEIFVQLCPWILKVQPERQGNNVIPVASQDLKYKREQEHTRVEFQSWQVFPLHPFREHPSPFWHLTWECTRVSMVPKGSVWSCVPPSLSCSTQPCTPWSLSEPGNFLKASCCLWLPCLSYCSSFASAKSPPFFFSRLHSNAPFL